MASWDIFHGDRLEFEQGLTTSAVRDALTRGELRDDDLARPAGTAAPWSRLADIPELLTPVAPSRPPPDAPAPAVSRPTAAASAGPAVEPGDLKAWPKDPGLNRALAPTQEATLRAPDRPKPRDDADDVAFPVITDAPAHPKHALPVSSSGTLPIDGSSHWSDAGALAEAPEEEGFSLSRSGPLTVEELDLAPMVDVAFQLVLFFMVAAQTVLYKTLEIPKPTTEQAPAAVAQGRSRTLDDLKDDYILVEIDSSGAMKLDRQPIVADMTTLVERLRSAREATRRKAMLLSADFATPHRSAVLAYDAANEIGLGIVIARPPTPQGPGPRLLPGPLPANPVTKPEPAAGAVPN